HTLQIMQQHGYPAPLDSDSNNANIFYHEDDGLRILLERSGNQWIGKNEEVVKSTEEMYDIANNAPWRLSTNVVTRPIMQELIFPTLAAAAVESEISHSGTLKSAPETVGTKMPPVVPRLSITFNTDTITKLLYKRALKAEDDKRTGTAEAKPRWLLPQKTAP